jgi:predicted nucleic acid-binding protein
VGRNLGAGQAASSATPQNDTWIAACCLVYDLPLATLNVKDFEDFAQHEGLTIVSA